MRILKWISWEKESTQINNIKLTFDRHYAPYLVIEVEASTRETRDQEAFGYGKACLYYFDRHQNRFRRKYFSAAILEAMSFDRFELIDEKSDEWQKFYNEFVIDKVKHLLVEV